MAETPSYAILGRGRWAGTIHSVLAVESRRIVLIDETRRHPSEGDADYQSRLSATLTASGARIAWLCVPPGPHIPMMVEAALEANLHVVVEKPWLCPRQKTEFLLELAQARRRIVAIHYQYCFLKEVQAWRRDFNQRTDLRFGGSYMRTRADDPGIPAIHNLGSHLLAIRAYAVPRSAVAEIRCGYELPDERRVWVEKSGENVAAIDFLANKEPIIQRFVGRLEDALNGAEFPFDLDLAARVSDDVASLK